MIGGNESLIGQDPVRGSPDNTALLGFDMHFRGTATPADLELLGNEAGNLATTFNAVGSMAVEPQVTTPESTPPGLTLLEKVLGMLTLEQQEALWLAWVERQRVEFATKYRLTPRLAQQAELVAQGLSGTEIQHIMGISEATFRSNGKEIRTRTRAFNRVEVALRRNGIPLGPERPSHPEL